MPGASEHYFIHTMCNHPDFIPQLAFVLEKNGEIIGNIMYTKAWLKDGEGKKWVYMLSTAADCCYDIAALEAFNATFPPKEKKWMPSQEEFYIYRHSSVVT